MLQNERIKGSPLTLHVHEKKLKSHDVPSVRGKTELVNCKVKKFYKVGGIKLDLYSFIVCKLGSQDDHRFEDASKHQY